MPKALNDGQVLAEVRRLVLAGNIRWRSHAEDRMEERGYSKYEAKDCLLRGRFVERPVTPNRRGPTQYQFAMGANVDGRPIRVVASLVPDAQVVVISVVDPKPRGTR